MEKQLLFRRAITFAIMLLLPATHFAQNASFQGLGQITGQYSEAQGVSYDGSVVVGVSTSTYNGGDVYEAFRWTETEGMQGIGTITENNFFSWATGVSADGSVIVGYSRSEIASVWEAFRWTEAEGMMALGDLVSDDPWSDSKDVSADGTIITGRSLSVNQGFRWQNGQMENITGEGVLSCEAWGISGDGEVIVGSWFDGTVRQGFRWTEESGLQNIGTALGGGFLIPYKTSYDGAVIVGGMQTPEGREAFRWTEDSGVIGLGNFSDNFYSEANDVSDDGEIIVGVSSGWEDTQAFIWTENQGMQNLQELLENSYGLGFQLTGWTLSAATAISGDGSTIVGVGISPQGDQEAWRVVLPFSSGGECIAPDSFSTGEITGTTVGFSWNPVGGETNGYNWFVMNFGESPDSGTPVASGTTEPGVTNAIATGLTPNTAYFVYLQTNCSESEQSGYGGAFTIMTTGGGSGCTAPDSFSTGEITGTTVGFSWNSVWGETNGYNWFVMNFGESPDSGTPVASGTTEPGVTSATATGLTPNTAYFVYLQTNCSESEQSGYGGAFMIMTIGGGGECIQPSDITVNTVTGSVVFISWTENGDASQWEIEYGEAGFTQGEGTTILDNDGTPGEAISGLEEGIDYDVYVRAICDFSGSEWVGPVMFNTQEMGINEQENQMILYPNPTTGIINLQTKEMIKSVSVYNLAGQRVSFNSLNKENTSIDISNLPRGIYFVEITLDNKAVKRYKVIRK